MDNTIQNIKIDELKLTMVELVARQPFEAFTVDKIKGLIEENKKTKTNYATIHRKAESLVKQGIFTKSMYGMASQIRINLKSEKTVSLLALIETKKFEMFFSKLKGGLFTSINEIAKDAKSIAELKCVIIFGSYAKGMQTKESDVDILIIYEPSNLAKENIPKDKYKNYIEDITRSIKGILKTSELKGGPRISPIVVNAEEHKEMILNKEINVAKETLLNHIILKGFGEYWKEIAGCKENVI